MKRGFGVDRCNLCPRGCGVNRKTTTGFCGVGSKLKAARAGLHFWEEPCICSTGGAGAIFFSGCNLRCKFCQNIKISRNCDGKEITVKRLREIIDELVWQGADTIDLVTPTHYTDIIAAALKEEKPPIPVVWNSSGYEKAETLKLLDGLVDIYLPDFKYSDGTLARRLSDAADYPQTALSAIGEMFRQTGKFILDDDGMMSRGVIVRHLVLPGFIENTLGCLDMLTDMFARDDIMISLMSQYTPPETALDIESLNRRLTREEYDEAVGYLYLLGWDNGFVQELSSAEAEYTPDFDCSGV